MLPKVKRNIKRISTAERSMRARKMNVMSAMFSGMNIKIISCIGIQQPGAPAGGHLGKPGWGCPCPPGRDIKTRPIIISSPSSCIRPEWLPLLILPPAWSIPPRIGCLRSRDFPARLWLAGRRHVTEPQAPVQCSLVLVSVSPQSGRSSPVPTMEFQPPYFPPPSVSVQPDVFSQLLQPDHYHHYAVRIYYHLYQIKQFRLFLL